MAECVPTRNALWVGEALEVPVEFCRLGLVLERVSWRKENFEIDFVVGDSGSSELPWALREPKYDS